MSNSKISALTSATTPLAGTETLPIVQSSTTKQVSVANLTAGRAVNVSTLTATGTISTTGTSSYFLGLAGASVFLQNSNATANWQLFPNGTTLDFYLNSAQNGNFVIQNPVNIVADTTLTSANLVQGTAAKGINFTANTPAAGMTSQLLNWYEEGTFTPTIILGGGTITYTTQRGVYTRVGRLITVEIYILVGVAVTPSGTFQIGGLPFASSAGLKGSTSAPVVSGWSATLTGPLVGSVDVSTTTIRMYEFATGTLSNPGAKVASGCDISLTLSYSK